MDALEPWNMFTNDFVAEETDEILTDEVLAEHRRVSGEEQVKQEPEDPEDPQEPDIYTESATDLGKPPISSTNRDEDGEDDDAIFNFELEPQVNINNSFKDNTSTSSPAVSSVAFTNPHVLRSSHSVGSGGVGSSGYNSRKESNSRSSNNNDDPNINFEIAVVYICPACGSEFETQEKWKRHMNYVHNFNTRRGLNFVQVDKLYHECLECHKRIAMHAMENLLKHKFTHLPYRCTKCKVCLRQYKYRQDLMVHLRMTHRDDLMTMSIATSSEPENSKPTHSNGKRNQHTTARGTPLEIKDIKENAIDIFGNTYDDGVEVKNEVIEPDDSDIDAIAEQASSSFVLPSFLEDALSRSSSRGIPDRQNIENASNGKPSTRDEELCEKYILYMCPQCGAEYETKGPWLRHIENVHDLATRKGLNFQEINQNQQAQCLECNKVISVNTILQLQLHKFGHLPLKSWLRCKICLRSCVGQREIVKHLMKQHRLGDEYAGDESMDERPGGRDADEEDEGFGVDSLLTDQSKGEERDAYEPHIDYLCPQCGKEFLEKKHWRRHIVKTHHLTDLQVLNFKVINERQVMCLECEKVITNAYGIQNAQQHRITHMPYKAFIRCRMCTKSYTDRKGLVKHLRSVHRIGEYDVEQMSGYNPRMSTSQYMRPLPPLQPRPNHSTPLQQAKQRPVREIVRHADVTFEIQFLDDDSNAIHDDAPVPELSFNNSRFNSALHPQAKCSDCGSIFTTERALRAHMQEEHEFLDFNNLQPLTETPRKSNPEGRPLVSLYHSQVPGYSGEEQSNDANGDGGGDCDSDNELLLMPGSGEEEEVSNSSGAATTSGQATSNWSIERHFCYMCPACGEEFRLQRDWRQHINEAHNFDKRHYLNFTQVDKFRYQCTICKDIVSSSKLKGLQDHKFRHLPYKLFIKCLLCSTCYNHKPNMISHLRVRHNIGHMRTNSSGGEREFNYMHHSLGPTPPAVSRAIERPANIGVSQSSNKPPGLKTVEDCISFHNAVDHATITYFCPQCNKNFDSHVFWRKHIVDDHNLNSREGLNFRQIDEHHYLCLQCYKRVTVTHTKGAIGQLQSHKFRHLPYKSFKCLACNGEFVRKQMFFKHLNRDTNRCDSSHYQEQRNDDADAEAEPDAEPVSVAANKEPARGSNGGSATSNSLVGNQLAFGLVCPQCGLQYDSWGSWRVHINIEHSLGKREKLRFKRLQPDLHQCIDCKETVNGRKLRDLQTHRFKHLPYGAYIIQCKFCSASYQHIRNMENHMQQKHPNVVQRHDDNGKSLELQQLEEQDEDNSSSASIKNEANASDTEQHEQMEVDDEEADDQYVLG